MSLNATLIGQLVSFAFFVFFCMKFIWPVFTDAMTEREKKIADGLNAADKAEQDLQEAQAKVEAELSEAKKLAAEIIDQANKRASQIFDEAKDDALSEGDRLKVAAQSDIEQEANIAREALRSKVAELSVVGAEKILERSVDQGAHSDMLDKLAASL